MSPCRTPKPRTQLVVIAQADKLDYSPVIAMVRGVPQPIVPVLSVFAERVDEVVDSFLEGGAVCGDRQARNERGPAAVFVDYLGG